TQDERSRCRSDIRWELIRSRVPGACAAQRAAEFCTRCLTRQGLGWRSCEQQVITTSGTDRRSIRVSAARNERVSILARTDRIAMPTIVEVLKTRGRQEAGKRAFVIGQQES